MNDEKLWIYKEVSEQKAREISAATGISMLLSKVFLNRGIEDIAYINSFLRPSIRGLYNPFLLRDMDKAVDKITDILEKNKKIIVYGDYDVDGISSTSLLVNFFNSLGADIDYYIPDRMEEGYGLSKSALDKIRESNPGLIITVDCGITAVEEVQHIMECGIDLIITDHHECKGELPCACAIINPSRPDCKYPFKKLAGVGIAFKLVHALCIKLELGEKYLEYLDLVALGTIADVVELTDENRIIAKYGLERLEKSTNIGMNSLIHISGLKDKPMTSWGVGFALAPRINAAGRIGHAGRAVCLFTTKDEEEAEAIAAELNDENKYRQDMEAEIYRQALEMVETQIDLNRDRVIVICGNAWHHGVIGIVASKITEKYYRPCILFSHENGICKGSGRSIEGFNLFKALTECEGFLEKYGGHELAAGLTLKEQNLEGFKSALNTYARSVLADADLIPKIKIDVQITDEDVCIDGIKELELLAPFGAGNPSPIFAYRGLRLVDARTVGADKHLKLRLEGSGTCSEAVGFNMGSRREIIEAFGTMDVACSLEINTWNSMEKVQLNLKDIQPNEKMAAERKVYIEIEQQFADLNFNAEEFFGKLVENHLDLSDIIPDRQDLSTVYKHIKMNARNSLILRDLFIFAKQVADSYNINMNYFKLKKGLEIFVELNLLQQVAIGRYGLRITIQDQKKGKTNLENSELYRRLQALKLQQEQALMAK